MKEPHVHAKCGFTLSGQPDIRYNVIIRAPEAKLAALQKDPKNAGKSDKQLWESFVGPVVTVLHPVPAIFSLGCTPYPEGQIPTEIEGRDPSGTVSDLTFWAV